MDSIAGSQIGFIGDEGRGMWVGNM